MDYLQALILSVVEGISEFLPISSTGHLILVSEMLKITQTDFVKSFEVIIQLGAILAIVVLYGKRIVENKKMWRQILAAFLPTAVIGFGLYTLIKQFLIGNEAVTLWALLLGGIAIIAAEKLYKEQPHHIDTIEKLSLRKAVVIGLAQSLAVIPGVSRSAATIVGGLFLGMKRKASVEFSFLLAIPTMAAATGLDLVKSQMNFTNQEWALLAVGFVGSFITALLAVKYFLRYVEHHTFIVFGIYRIVIAVVFWLFLVR